MNKKMKRLTLYIFLLFLTFLTTPLHAWNEDDIARYNKEMAQIAEEAKQRRKKTQAWKSDKLERLTEEAEKKMEEIEQWRNTELSRVREKIKKLKESEPYTPKIFAVPVPVIKKETKRKTTAVDAEKSSRPKTEALVIPTKKDPAASQIIDPIAPSVPFKAMAPSRPEVDPPSPGKTTTAEPSITTDSAPNAEVNAAAPILKTNATAASRKKSQIALPDLYPDITINDFKIGTISYDDIGDGTSVQQIIGDLTNRANVNFKVAFFKLAAYDKNNNLLGTEIFEIRDFNKHENRSFAVRFRRLNHPIKNHKIIFDRGM